MSMKARPVEESTLPVIPEQAPAEVVPIPVGPLQTPYPEVELKTLCANVSGFKAFEGKIAVIQAAVKRSRAEINEDERYQQWLHSYTAFSDCLAPERVERQVKRVMWNGARTNRKVKVRVNQVRACWLQNDDTWGDHEDTTKYYLDRLDRSANMRKKSKVGHLQLVHSKPKYPDPWSETRPETIDAVCRGFSPKRLRCSVGKPYLKISYGEVQPFEFCGPLKPLESTEYSYPGDWHASLATVLGAPSEFIAKVHRYHTVGHCEKPTRLCEKRADVIGGIHFKQSGYPAEVIMSAMPMSDEIRYNLYWDQKQGRRIGCKLLEMIAHPVINEMTWEFQRSLVRRKGFLALRTKCMKSRSSKDDKNVMDARLRMYENHFYRGKMDIETYHKARKTLRDKIAFLEARRLLPVAVGKPYGDYSREEKIALIRFGMANGVLVAPIPIVEIHYNELKPIDYKDPDTADVITDHSVCRLLGDGSECASLEHAKSVFESSNDNRYISELSRLYVPDALLKTKFVQLESSGLWVPKSMLEYRPVKDLPKMGPCESETVVKRGEDSSGAVPISKWEKFTDWLANT